MGGHVGESLSMGTLVATACVSILTLYVFYNLFLHPLASVPGPILCRSGLYSYTILRAIKRDASYHFDHLHKTYGNYVRIGRNEIMTVDEAAWREVYAPASKWQRGPAYSFFGVGATKGLIAESDNDKHAVLRRMAAPAYTVGALKELEPNIDGLITLLDKKMRTFAEREEPWDSCTWLQWLATDIIGQLALGQSFGLLESECDSTRMMKALDQNIHQSAIQGVLPVALGRLHRSFILAIAPILGSGAGKLRQVTIASVMDRSARVAKAEKDGGSDEENKDMLTHFIKARNPHTGKPMSFVELCTNAGSLIAAGADTTAITMRAVLYYALTIPRVYDRIMAELQEAYDSGLLRFPVRYEDAKKLEYLEATIKEALRYFPAGSLLLPRLSPENGAHLGGFYLPPGTQLGMTAYTYHRRAYGPDGAEFRPERWLRDPKDGDATADSKRKRREANFMSFGSGPHMCIGRNISMMEMTKVLPHLFWHFKMKITPRGPGSPHQYPYGRGMDGVINGEVWFVQGGWFTMQRDLFLDITVRKVEE